MSYKPKKIEAKVKEEYLLESNRFSKLKELVSCGHCGNVFCDPVTLFCQHTFCQSCLILNQQESCFICQQSKVIPININFQLREIVEKIFTPEYFQNRQKELDQIVSSDLQLKKRIQIYKSQFNEILANIIKSGGKFTIRSPLMIY